MILNASVPKIGDSESENSGRILDEKFRGILEKMSWAIHSE